MLKWYQNLISFWRPLGTQFFRYKRRQDAKTAQIGAQDESAQRNAQPPGEGWGEGSRRLMSGTWLWKDPEGLRRPGFNDSARRPQLGGGSLRAFRRAILRIKRSMDRLVGWPGGKWIAKIDTKIDPKSMPNRWISELDHNGVKKSHLRASWGILGVATDSGPPRRRRGAAEIPPRGDGYRSSKKSHLRASWGVLGAATDSGPPRRRRGAAKIPPRGDGYRSSKKLHLKASWGVLGVAADSEPPRRRCGASRTPPRVPLGPPNIKRTLIQYIQYVL